MPKKKGETKDRKIRPNVGLVESETEEKEIEKTNIKKCFGSIEIQRQKVIEFLGGNEMPKNFSHREKELKELKKYVEDCLTKKNKSKYKIMMVTGSPGAGKSLSVNHILAKLEKEKSVQKIIRFNANIIKTVKDVHEIICNELLERNHGNNMSTLQIIRVLEEEGITTKIVVYIEEVEVILEQKTNIFTEDFFLLFSNPKLNIMMLGVSNTIDALAKYSKNIAVNLNEIKNVVFEPYKVENIVDIMKEKLAMVNDMFGIKIDAPEKVLKFIAGKMENIKKGDIRIVLEFLRELAKSVIPQKASEDIGIGEEGYPVSMSKAQTVFAKMRAPKFDIIMSLPHTQQIVLIAIYLHIKENDCLYMTLKNTEIKTKWVCDSLGLEFHPKIVEDSLEILEQYGLISRMKKQNEVRVMLKLAFSEVQISLEEHKLFRKFFVSDDEK